MNYSNLGYFFELRQDIKGNLGLKEDFKCIYRGTDENPKQTLEINITAGIDFMGNLLKPAYNSLDGFVPLQYQLNSSGQEDMVQMVQKFCKSHKPWFSIINKSFYLVVDGKLVYDVETGNLKENGLSLYAPKTTSTTYEGFKTKRGEILPSLLAYKVATKAGYNKMQLNELVIKSLYRHILNELEPVAVTSREDYTLQRINYTPIQEIPEGSWSLNQEI